MICSGCRPVHRRYPDAGVPCLCNQSHSLGMATFEQTLQTLEALLHHKQTVSVSAADEAIWAYLAPLQGLDAQTDALDKLNKAVLCLGLSPRPMPALMDAIDRHWQRLAGLPA